MEDPPVKRAIRSLLHAVRRRVWAPGAVALALLVAMCAVRYHSRGFFSAATGVNLLTDNAVLGIVAVGLTFVIIAGGIDLAVGAVMSASSVLCAVLLVEHGYGTTAAISITLAGGLLYGAAAGAVIHATRLPAFIVTLAGMFLVRGLGYLLHLESVAIDHEGHAALASMRVPLWPGLSLPATATLLLVAVIIGQSVLSSTRFGLHVRALGGNEHAAMVQGVPVFRTKVFVYALSGFFGALGGVALTLYLSSGSHLEGIGLELDAIAAVVIGGAALAGGAGSVVGTLVGAITVGLVLTAITNYESTLNSGLTRVAIGALLLGFLLAQRLLKPSASHGNDRASVRQ